MHVWTCIFVSAAVVALFLDCAEPAIAMNSLFQRVTQKVFLMIGHLLGKGDARSQQEDSRKNLSVRFLLSVWWFTIITLSSSFTSCLMSRLAIPRPTFVIDTVQDLFNAVLDKGIHVLVFNGSIQTDFFQDFPATERKVFQRSFRYVDTSREDEESIAECENDRKCVNFRFDATAGALNFVDCGIHLAKDVALLRHGCFAFPSNSPLIESFNKIICRVMETGLKELAERNGLWKESMTCLKNYHAKPELSWTFSKQQQLTSTLLIPGYLVATFVQLVELIVNIVCTRNTRKTIPCEGHTSHLNVLNGETETATSDCDTYGEARSVKKEIFPVSCEAKTMSETTMKLSIQTDVQIPVTTNSCLEEDERGNSKERSSILSLEDAGSAQGDMTKRLENGEETLNEPERPHSFPNSSDN